MAVLQWGFSGGRRNPHAPANHRERQVVYTGTHDNTTVADWWDTVATPDERRRADAAAAGHGIDDPEPHWRMVRLAHASVAELAVVPMQDLLGTGADTRMNAPGTEDGNWAWRMDRRAASDALAERLRTVTRDAGRAPAG
jgi:4-alpha-glucanotransferase